MPDCRLRSRARVCLWTGIALVLAPVITMAETHVGGKSTYSQAVAAALEDELAPAVAFGGGVFMVVWEYAYSGADDDVRLRLVSPTGTPQGVSTDVVATTRREGSPAVAHSGSSGNCLVVWEGINALGDWDIVGQLFDADSSAVGSRLEIAAGTSEQRRPAVAWGGGRWLIVWEHQVTAVINDLRGLLLEDDGTVIGSELVVSSGEADESAPAAAWGSDRFLVAWQDAGAGEYDIVARTVASNGDLGSALVLASWEWDQIRPALAYSPEDESFLVVWEDHHWGWGEDWDIYARRVDTGGAAVGSLLAISWEGDDPRTAPAIAYNSGNTEYQVVWEYETSDGNWDLYRRRVSPGGELLGVSAALAELTTQETAPAAAGDGEYGYLVSWEDSRNAGVCGAVSVFGAGVRGRRGRHIAASAGSDGRALLLE